MALLIIGLEIIVLYLLSRKLSQNLYIVWFLLTKSRPVAIGFLSFLFFPGTVIHELAHLFTAEILGVHTGGLTLVPEGLEDKNVRTGSVAIAQSDPIRRAAIGIAPVFVGLGSLGLISYFIPGIWNQMVIDASNTILFSQPSLYLFLLSGYSLFAISNTMFSSHEDMEGFWPVVIIITLISAAAYIAGIRITLTETIQTNITEFFTGVAVTLGYVTGLNISLFLISKALIAGTQKLTGRVLITKS
jgi:hypothetical protein